MRSHIVRIVPVALAITSIGCGRSEPDRLPHQLPAPPAAAKSLPTRVDAPLAALPAAPATDPKKVALGERLYFDPMLSGDGTISCASCHALDKGGTDSPRRTSLGIHGQEGPINAPTVFNAAFNVVQFWDGRAASLEEQAAGPVANPKEMGAEWDAVVAKLQADPIYTQAFVAAGYPEGPSKANATHAIAEYERTLVTPARFDRFAGGDVGALSEDEREGLGLFTTLGCTGCHSGPAIGGTMFQKMGVMKDYFALRGTPLTDADLGRFNVTRKEPDKHFFKVPTMRNVELTAPYFHDGAVATLEAAIDTMARVQLGRALPPTDIAKLAAFLRSLTGEKLPTAPAAPPKGAMLGP